MENQSGALQNQQDIAKIKKINYFLIEIWIGRSNRQNQDIAKSWQIDSFNYFLISIKIRKRNHQNQDIGKSWKNHIFNDFLIRILIKKKQPSKPRYCQKLEKTNFHWLFN